jgi:hypothetical protein
MRGCEVPAVLGAPVSSARADAGAMPIVARDTDTKIATTRARDAQLLVPLLAQARSIACIIHAP